MIAAQGLQKLYASGQGLEMVSFSIRPGEFVGILGHSGAGKTTLMRLLAGSIFPTGGRLEVLGCNLAAARRKDLLDMRRRIATVYQNFNVVPSLDVARNVMLGQLGRRSLLNSVRSLFWLADQDRRAIMELLAELGIAEKMYSPCQELSGGQQQRVAIARAVFSDAALVLADEPIASVDPATATLIMEQFRTMQQQGKTVILNLHQVSSAVSYCSRLITLQQGRIVYDGPPDGFEATEAYSQLIGEGKRIGAGCDE
ncbi:phosphonate ABC transporter ATP-binding protein [Sporomusa sphaeroides]|uniref:Phosphonates import ATP-binding protein PhnC n=1 Tax=uncultured Sporomusa sp. TaxID=307249 RepID=A0A212LV01_9FIRM|nr:ATP-binding cassette domain-containing protein [Sporomusa sphaeroides]SCM81363.1 Phosphonates import ATP-binding protein PhnC [uncultured Sporomusa sp.]HML33654.1 ATP-binding cassette domain-containing protein [Sporomusa sphaeroides]